MEGALSWFGGIAGAGIFVAGLGVAYAQFKTGAGNVKDSLIRDLKETIEQERQKVETLTKERDTLIASHQKQINELNTRIGKLEGAVEANEKKAEEYLSILQGRSPDQEAFLKFITTVAKEAAIYMQETTRLLNEIHSNTEKQKRTKKSTLATLSSGEKSLEVTEVSS